MRILGYGRQSGRVVETGEALENRLGLAAGALTRGVGIETRTSAGLDQSQLSLGVDAARAALGRAGLDLGDIDLVVSAASVPYQPIPSLSAILLSELGAPEGAIETFDINATCLSFLSALNVVQSMIDTGQVRRVLVISSEVPGHALDMVADPRTGAIFSDGAAALVLGDGASFDIAAWRMRTFPSGREHCRISGGGTRYPALRAPEKLVDEGVFRMRGDRLMSLTARHMPGFLTDLLDGAALSRADIDLVVPHQASPHALAMMARVCDLDPEIILDTARTRGNRVAASLPDTLIEAIETGRMPADGRILMIGTSAGISLGGAVIEVRS